MELKQDSDNFVSYEALELYQPPTAHRPLFQQALDRAVAKVTALVPVFGLRNPRMGIPGTNRYAFCIPDEWVASFWCGQMWLAYSLTGDNRLCNSARMRWDYFNTVLEYPRWHDHDLGFLFSLSAVADYSLTGSKDARKMALRAADFLAARWRQPMPFVMCWNPMLRDEKAFREKKTGTLNIDSMQAMSLLFWASRVSGQSSFADIANMHLQTSKQYLVREDFSSYHAYEFNPRTGEPIGGFTHQGLHDKSCWSRGQAWAIHGFAQAYMYTGIPEYRDTAAQLTDYIAARLPDDGVPLWDYNLTSEHTPYRDSSAGAITAAGIYTLARCFGEGEEGDRYTAIADKMLHGLVSHCDISDDDTAEGLLKEGAAFVGLKRSNTMLPYGDYYYLEALMRAVGHSQFFW
ncbi:MAG: glycoside hydrolase family 88 protein [Gammaproteobacteria bacterium]|nr:glycoside hydrolase family 88 protein [Gammaproteobacteria bacterium]